jgi:hypothetical protein
LDAAVFAVS